MSFGIFKLEQVCKTCKHPSVIHLRSSYCHMPFCKCNNFISIDNLTYVEYVASQTLLKRILTVLFMPFLRFFVWYRGKDTIGEFIVLKCLVFPAVAVGCSFLVAAIIYGIHDTIKQQVLLEKSIVKCYTGNILLYSGKVQSITNNEIIAENGNRYVCSGMSEEEEEK